MGRGRRWIRGKGRRLINEDDVFAGPGKAKALANCALGREPPRLELTFFGEKRAALIFEAQDFGAIFVA